MKDRMKNAGRAIWVIVPALIAVEQGIKILIIGRFLDRNIPLLPPLVYFRPMFNRDYSWFNSMLQLGIGKWLHIAVTAILILLIFRFYSFLKSKDLSGPAIHSVFAFLISGAACSFIDKVFWNGSLDYIALSGLFTFDLKDLYIDTSIALMILFTLLENGTVKRIFETKDLMRDFLRFLFIRKPHR